MEGRVHLRALAFGGVSQLGSKRHPNKWNSVGYTDVKYVHLIRFSKASMIQQRVKTTLLGDRSFFRNSTFSLNYQHFLSAY